VEQLMFELRIRFKGNEGDEMPVVDLMTVFGIMIEQTANVELLPMELSVTGERSCAHEGRVRAARN